MKSFFFVLVSLFSVFYCFADDYSFKYGKVTDYELAMTSYAPDTSATAVYIYRNCDMKYVLKERFVLEAEHTVKVKVLKDDYVNKINLTLKGIQKTESITSISATVYNLVDGKVVKTKLSDRYIVKEKAGDGFRIKLAFPNVKIGSVVEYRYTRHTETPLRPADYNMQSGIPVVHSCVEFTYPEYFRFNIATAGYEKVDVSKKDGNASYQFKKGGAFIPCSTTQYTFVADSLPQMNLKDPMLFSPSEYRTHIVFELQSVNIPGRIPVLYNESWESVENRLLKSEYFGGWLGIKNPLAGKMAEIDFSALSVDEKVQSCLTLLKSVMNVKSSSKVMTGDPLKAFETGAGFSAQANFILMSMLRSLNIASVPVVLRQRSSGRLPLTSPTLNRLTDFVVCYLGADNRLRFVDTSTKSAVVNVLHSNNMTDRARMIKLGEYQPSSPSASEFDKIYALAPDAWLDLSTVSSFVEKRLVDITLTPDDKIKGVFTTLFSGNALEACMARFAKSKDSIDVLERKWNITITGFNLERKADKFVQTIEFEKNPGRVDNDILILDAVTFPVVTKSDFVEASRKFPIEISLQRTNISAVTLHLPQGYTVESVPESVMFSLEDKGMYCTMRVAADSQTVKVDYTNRIQRLIYKPEEYMNLKDYYSRLVEVNKTKILIRKPVKK